MMEQWMVQSNLHLILILFEKTSLFALKIKGTTGIFEGLKYRGKLFGLISNDGEWWTYLHCTHKNQLLPSVCIQSDLEIWKAFVINLEVSFLCINLFLHVSFEHNYVSCYSGEMSTQYSWHKWPQAYLPDAYKESWNFYCKVLEF